MFYSRSTLSRLWQHLFGYGNCDELMRIKRLEQRCRYLLEDQKIVSTLPHAEVGVMLAHRQRTRFLRDQPLNSPPVAFFTFATTFCATCSISASVSVRSMRRKRDLDGERFLACRHALALEYVEDVHARNQALLGPFRRLHHRRCLNGLVDQKGEVTLNRLIIARKERSFGCSLAARRRNTIQEHLEYGERTGDIESFQRLGMQLAEMAEHDLRTELQSP